MVDGPANDMERTHDQRGARLNQDQPVDVRDM